MGFKGLDNQEVNVDVKNTRSSRDAMKRLFDVYAKAISPEERAEMDREFKDLKKGEEAERSDAYQSFAREAKQLHEQIMDGFLYNVRKDIESIPLDLMSERVKGFLYNFSGETIDKSHMTADIVLPLQIALCRWKPGIVKVDGIYGPQFQSAILKYQSEQLKDKSADFMPATGESKKATLQSLVTFLDPNWNPNQTVEINRRVEKQEMQYVAPDKLHNTGNKLFEEKRIEDAGNYYKAAADKRSNAPKNIDRSAQEKAEKSLDPLTVAEIKKYINSANNMMDDALKFPNPRAEFKIDTYNEAAKLLVLAWNVDPYACNIILRNRKRIDNQPTHTAQEADRMTQTAEENLARVKQSLHDATYGKLIPATGARQERRLPAQPDKIPVWEKQVQYREGELAKAKQFNNSFDRVIDDPNTPQGNMTTIRAYLDNYLGPIPRDLPPTPTIEKNRNVIYRTKQEEQRTPRAGVAIPVQERRAEPRQAARPEVRNTPTEIRITMSDEEPLPKDYAEKNFAAIKFLEKYFTNGQTIMDACGRLSATGRITYVVQNGDTPLSIAQMAGIPRYILATQNDLHGGETPEPGRVLDVTPQRDQPSWIATMRSRIMIMKIADPFMKLYDQYNKNDKNPEFITKCKDLAARTKISLPSGEYTLSFKDQF